MVLLAVMAAGVHTMTIAAAPARAWQEQAGRAEEAAQERAVVPQSAAASEGLPIPALLGGIVLAFAVGLTAGQVQRRRRLGRREAARLRPDPVPDPVLPARAAAAVAPAPAPPAPKAPAPPKIVKPAPPPPPPPPPPPEPKRRKPKAKPPEPVAPPEPPKPVAPTPEPPKPVAKPPEPVAPPDEHVERHEPVAEPHEPVAEPHESVAEPVAEIEPVEPPARAGEHALGRAPEVPRPQEAREGRREPAVSLDAPEAVGGEPRRPTVPMEPDILPGRRFARERPWPEEAEKLWTCEIAWKAGYVKSSFRAMAGPPGGDGRRKPIGESPSLRWTLMTDPEPPTPEMIAGVKALIGALVAAGWQRTEPGGPWYAQRFLWRGQGEPRPVEVPEPAQPAEPPTR